MPGRGVILRIDLTSEKVTTEPIPPELCRRFLGGEGINSWLLWEHFLRVDPRTDPLSPDNVLIAGVGPLAATGYGGGSKMKWTFKSPAYHIFGDTACGGTFPAALRWAGYDHMVITGRARRPLYIWVDNQRVELRDAGHLWGKDAMETDARLKAELGDADVETAAIGQAAENLVGCASVTIGGFRSASRTGAGAVFASKNLKAIAVRGSRGLSMHDPSGFFKAMDAFIAAAARSQVLGSRDGWRKYGTLTATRQYNITGVNAFRNNQGSVLPQDKYQKLSHHVYVNQMATHALACSPGCTSGCSGRFRLKGDESPAAATMAGRTGYKPEYVAVAAFGIMCDIPDMPAVAHLKELCDQHGIDVAEAGAISAFLMELWQQGLVTAEDAAEWFGEPVALEWGSYQAVEKVILSIASQSNKLGQLFREGLYRGASRLEQIKEAPVLKYALYGKGGAPFIEEVRHTVSWATNMAVASRGSDHLKGFGTLDKVNRPDISQFYFGRPDGAQPLTTTLKGASSALAEVRCAIVNSLGLCVFIADGDPILFGLDLYARALKAATGMDFTAQDIQAAAQRTVNIEKAFNSRLGLRREDDRLCQRWMKQAIADGPGQGWKAEDYLEQVKDEYYQWHGWDPRTSLPRRSTLEALGMTDVADVLEREGALAV